MKAVVIVFSPAGHTLAAARMIEKERKEAVAQDSCAASFLWINQ